MTFRYEGFDCAGRPKTGKVEAPNREEAVSILRIDMRVFANKIEEDGPTHMKTVFNHDDRPGFDMAAEATPRPYSPDEQATSDMYANVDRAQLKKAPGPVAGLPPLPEGGDNPAPVEAVAVTLPERKRRMNYQDDPDPEFDSDMDQPVERTLADDVAGISAALRELDLLKQDTTRKGYAGPVIGKKTWAILDKVLPKAAETMLTDALRAEAHRQKALRSARA